ncbi:potassium channel family protein [Saccharibacillus kuerlensis]|uniref:Membrane protein YdjJ n=1 Tax=Saccharibacillus kuerlensis TaxID=459527 RepID=A0ABQ2L8E0_9BACL|nr:potassium channel family protein [Saccharibacillus kuerlensis]GGO04567.1 putative membrane protein YdjJ [Saccharibacillus kuerlensis]
MNEWYAVAGFILLGIGLIDFVWSTLWVEGGTGPVTMRLSAVAWKGFRALFGRRPQMLSLAGPIILSLTVLTWIGLFWVGWTLVFASDPHSLIDTRTDTVASWGERFYFSAYALFTLGNGSIIPNGTRWEMATIATTATGMLSITLAVTYLISVLSAAAQKRAFAQNVFGMGRSAEEILSEAWNGSDFHDMDLLLHDCASQLSSLTSQHHAYPILHYYHSERIEQSGGVAVAVLDDIVSLLQFGVRSSDLINKLILKETRSSIDNYVSALGAGHPHKASQKPDAPRLTVLREQGIPVQSDEAFEQALKPSIDRRQKLLGILQMSARKWPKN